MSDSDAESSRFAHPIGNIILDELIGGVSCEYGIDEDGAEVIFEAAEEVLLTPEAETMLKVIEEVAAFLDTQDGAEASAVLREILQALDLVLTEHSGSFQRIADDDGVESTFGRRAEAVVREKSVHTAPKLGEDKPEGTLSVQDLIGTKRRM